jgi:hypothetical protein
MKVGSIIYILGVITLVTVLVMSSAALGSVAVGSSSSGGSSGQSTPTSLPGGPVVTALTNPSIAVVASVQAKYSWSTPIGPTSSSPLLVYLPSTTWLGYYSDGNYHAAVNFTVSVYNPGTSTGSVTIYVSCPPPLGTGSVSGTVSGKTTASFTITLRANVNATYGAQTCQVYTSLSTKNVTAVTVQVPVAANTYTIVQYNNMYYPEVLYTFTTPYFNYTGTAYIPSSINITPFGGVSIGSTVTMFATLPNGTTIGPYTGSDTSSFALPPPSQSYLNSSYDVLFMITSLSTQYYYEIIPAVMPFIPYAYSIFTSPLDQTVSSMYGMNGVTISLNNGVNMTTIYASPNGITIVPYGTLIAYYTNSSNYFTYPVFVRFSSFNESDTGIAFPAAPGSNNKFWLLAFAIDSNDFSSKLVVPEVYMFNVINPGYAVNKTVFTIVNGTAGAPLPSGLSLSATFTPNGNYTLVDMTLSTPIANITNKMILFEMYIYANTSLGWVISDSIGTIPIVNLNEPNITTTWWDFAIPSHEYIVVGWVIYNVSVTPSPYLRVLKTVGFATNFLSNVYLTPVVNMTVINNTGTPLPTLQMGLSLNVINVTMGSNHGATLVYTNQWGDYLYSQLTGTLSLTNDYYAAFASTPVIMTTPHLFTAIANVSNIYYLLTLAYPWGNMSVPMIEAFPNGSYVIVSNQSISILRPESVNEIFTYSPISGSPGLFMTGLIMTVAPILNVSAFYGLYAIPYVSVTPINYTGYCPPFVVTVPRHYVPLMCILNITFPFNNYTVPITKYTPPLVISTKYLSMFGFRNITWANYTYMLPNTTNAIIKLELPTPPFFPVHRVNATPTTTKVYVSKTVNITVTVTLNYTAVANETLEGYVYLNGSLVSTFNVTVPAGTNTTTTTVSFPAPSTPGTYNVTVAVGNQTSVSTLSVSPSPTTTTTPSPSPTPTPTPTSPTIIAYVVVAAAVITVIAAVVYTKHHRKRLIRTSDSGYV